ncbi:hypothetical protein [Neobacillus cucumis]|uniref:Uncharacterized protein n=1 Tax=Neobacillus cucumis TaxID=1740721 RepID=A0A2N5HRA3_9BACI|nr:hypothetical protein [Neobacillus cucumis]PLS08018.1 hypothetical protein CVD27_04900 [Neobacillus cucumis]
MNPTLIDFHKKRYEWAFKAIQEFIHLFDEYPTESDYTKGLTDLFHQVRYDLESPDKHTFNSFTTFLKESEEESKKELENYEKQLEQYKILFAKQASIIEHEKEEALLQADRFENDILHYDQFLKGVEFKKTDSDHIWELVDDLIEYTPYNRKASVINEGAARLQLSVERELEIAIRKIKQEAGTLKIEPGHSLEPPDLSPIPQIEQKIDAFWFKATYEKALTNMKSRAHDWLTEVYESYNQLLTSFLDGIKEQKEQVIKQAEASNHAYIQKINSLENEFLTYQKEEAELKAHYLKVSQLWNQFGEHASQLQGYLIQYWLEYKEELMQHFLYGHREERFLAAQYLQLLRQDGKDMIESLNGGGDE